jgi:hypothetical protein
MANCASSLRLVAEIEGLFAKRKRLGPLDAAFTRLLPVDKERVRAPLADAAALVREFHTHLFGASIPLGVFSAVIVSRLLFHQVRVTGVYIALFGGVASAIFLGVSGLATWTLSQPGVASDVGAMRMSQLLAFATGAFGNVTTLGLLLAGVGCWRRVAIDVRFLHWARAHAHA